MNTLHGKWPAVVSSYDGPSRMCRVSIQGITDGSNVLPLAEIQYPIGDRPTAVDAKDSTELRILVGDKVYVEFLRGDPRFPVITGHRLERYGNPTDWRRWRHANIEMTADGDMVFNAANLILNISGDMTEHIGGNRQTEIGGDETNDVAGAMNTSAATSEHTANTHRLTSIFTLAGSMTNVAGQGGAIGVKMTGGTYEYENMTITYTGCTIHSDGKAVDHTHTHNENNEDGAPTDPPNS